MRPSWDQYFMGMAHYVAIRSHDSQTKVGCVIANMDNNVVGIGYNGFPAGTDDSHLPTVRPKKYPYIVHSEQNALSNMLVQTNEPKKAYVTAMPCATCAKLLWQAHVREWYIEEEAYVNSWNTSDQEVFDFLINNGLVVNSIKTEPKFLKDVYSKIDTET
jgi:dCMP deaminase